MILFWLPLPSLLRVQAVNTHWRDLIRDSTILQQQLFYKPEKAEEIWLAEVSNLPAQQRPLPRNYKSSLRVLASVLPTSEVLKTYHGLMATPVRFNPLFLKPDPVSGEPEDVDVKVDRKCIAEYQPRLLELLSSIQQHSMREMLLTQPPVTSLNVEVLVKRRATEYTIPGVMFRGSRDKGLWSIQVTDPHGVRIGQVAEALEKGAMLQRAGAVKLFMHGVIVPAEADVVVVQRRTKKWHEHGRK